MFNTVKNKTLITILMLICIGMDCYAQKRFVVNEIATQNQLPVSAIHSIFKDSEGYMWYGTVNGICRDDGYDIKVFRSDFKNHTVLKDDLAECFVEDSHGNIWVGSHNGLYKIDKSDYSICPIDTMRWNNTIIRHMGKTSDNSIWIAAYGSICKYDEDGRFKKEYPIRINGETAKHSDCFANGDDVLYSIRGFGLFKYDKTEDKFLNLPNPLNIQEISSIVPVKDVANAFWLQDSSGDIYKVEIGQNLQDCKYTHFNYIEKKRSNTVWSLKQDDVYGYLWNISSVDCTGYEIIDGNNLKKVFDSVESVGIPGKYANVLNEGNNIWVSAFDQPSFFIQLEQTNVLVDSIIEISQRLNTPTAIIAVCDAGDDKLWMIQERTGLILADMTKRKFSIYSDNAGAKNYDLSTGYWLTKSHEENTIWMQSGHLPKVFKIKNNGMAIKVLADIDCSTLVNENERIVTLYEDNNDQLWIGTTRQMIRCQASTGQILKVYGGFGNVSDIVDANDSSFWVATSDNGIYHIHNDNSFSNYKFNKSFSSITISPDENIWLGTNCGEVFLYKEEENSLEPYHTKCGMEGDRVNKILTDEYNHIWINTNQKIIEFNPANNASKSYNTSDSSIKMHRFLPTASCKINNGGIIIGGIPGLMRLKPSTDLDNGPINVKVKITDISINNESILFPIKQEGQSTEAITIRPEDHNLVVSFSTLDFQRKNIEYRYKIEGLSEFWHSVEKGSNKAYISNLPKGNFKFIVKANDNNGLWSDEETVLQIKRLPAFYESNTAFVVYALLVISFFLLILFLAHKRDKNKNEILWNESSEMMKMREYLTEKENNVLEHISQIEQKRLDDLLLEKAISVIERNLSVSEFGVEHLSEAMNMSKSTLNRKLKSITNQTPLDLIRTIKMQHAQTMLKDPERNVSEVAIALGYLNRKYFTNCFKKEFGMTPSEYQKQQQETNK